MPRESLPQRHLAFDERVQPGAHPRREWFVMRRPELLGAVQRRLGLENECLGVGLPVMVRVKPMHAVMLTTSAAMVIGVAQGCVDPVDDQEDVPGIRDVLTEHQELIATEAGDGVHGSRDAVRGPQRCLETTRHLGEKDVAGIATQTGSDVGKAVEVDRQDRRRPMMAARQRQRGAQAFDERGTVGEPGERVVQRLEGLRHSLLGDVVDHQHGADQTAVAAEELLPADSDRSLSAGADFEEDLEVVHHRTAERLVEGQLVGHEAPVIRCGIADLVGHRSCRGCPRTDEHIHRAIAQKDAVMQVTHHHGVRHAVEGGAGHLEPLPHHLAGRER